MADARLGGADMKMGGVLASPPVNGSRLGAIVEHCARSMRVEVADGFRAQPSALASDCHGLESGRPFRVRLGEMMRVRGRAITDDFAKDGRAPVGGAGQGFKCENSCP